jgi:urease accessory protein
VFADALTLDGAIDEILGRWAVARGALAVATIVQLAQETEKHVGVLRTSLSREIEAGASAFDGMLVARLIARDGFTLRRALLDALRALGCAVPRAYTL